MTAGNESIGTPDAAISDSIVPDGILSAGRPLSGDVALDRTETVRSVIRELRIIIRALQGHSRAVERSCGISAAQLWALWEMQTAPGLKVSELSHRLSIHTSTTSNLLDKLEETGLVERRRRERDQRVVRLFVTPAGTQLLERAPTAPQGELHRALQELDPARLRELADTLGQVAANLHTASPLDGLRPLDAHD